VIVPATVSIARQGLRDREIDVHGLNPWARFRDEVERELEPYGEGLVSW
jgi:hypothetical protein